MCLRSPALDFYRKQRRIIVLARTGPMMRLKARLWSCQKLKLNILGIMPLVVLLVAIPLPVSAAGDELVISSLLPVAASLPLASDH